MKKSPQFLAFTVLFLGILSISFSALFVRWAQAPGVVSSFYRMGLASLVMFTPFIYQRRDASVRLPRVGVSYAVAGGVFFSLDLFFWTTGIVMSGATVPTLLANTAPLWVGLGAFVFFKERQRINFWAGLSIALLGASMILAKDLNQSFELGMGALFGIFAAMFYGAYHLASQRGRVYLNTISYFWISTVVAAVCLLGYVLILGHPLLGYDIRTWWLFVLMAILVQVVGWMFVNYAQGLIPAAIVSPTLLAQPLVTAVLAGLLLGELFSIWHLVGGLMVMGGVYLVHYGTTLKIRFPTRSSLDR
jgi:drug/metabolite transporter (DMT)-like permease